jgi:hypothetical protein
MVEGQVTMTSKGWLSASRWPHPATQRDAATGGYAVGEMDSPANGPSATITELMSGS